MHVCIPRMRCIVTVQTRIFVAPARGGFPFLRNHPAGAQRSTHVAPEKLGTLVLAVALTCCWLEIFFPSLPSIRPSQSRAQTRWVGGSVEEKTAIARAVAGEERSSSLSELRKTKHCCNPLQKWYVRRWCLHEHYIHTCIHIYTRPSLAH